MSHRRSHSDINNEWLYRINTAPQETNTEPDSRPLSIETSKIIDLILLNSSVKINHIINMKKLKNISLADRQ
jgi:hypothetical protein